MELPSKYVDRIFARFLAYYGEKFTRQWGMVDPADLKTAWGRELGDLSAEEIAAGLDACRTREWPPTLPEFRNLCRKPADYEAAFREAAIRWPSRAGWSNPAIYWAACRIGNDVSLYPYSRLCTAWRMYLDDAIASPRGPVPEPPELCLPRDPNEPKFDGAMEKCLENARNMGLIRAKQQT